MKKYQKGLVVPVLLIIISLLVVGGAIYIYNNEKVAITPVETSPTALTEKPTITDGSFVILPQTGLQAQSFLQKMQNQIGTNYTINLTGDSTAPTYRVDLPTDKFDRANDYLLSQFGEQNTKYISELGSGYENWHIICMSIGQRASSARLDLPYITCNDKIGIQKLDVVVKDIKAIDTDSRTFNLTIGNETMKVKMPSVVQNTSNGNGTFADFVRIIDSVQYQSSMFKMTGEIKGDIFEVSSIEWIFG
jgi:hypothetical protein